MSWNEFLDRVKNTIRTAETVEEYKKLSKVKQDEIKDVGGFVSGKLKDGKRKNGYVEYRTMLTLDMDYAAPELWEQITLFYDFTCCIYSTHKHTSEKPRLRLIIPLSRNVTADEYMAIGRMIASDIGIEQFDDTTYEPTRLMYWSSTSSDGDFVFEKQDGILLDPYKILSRYKDWHDSSKWPVSSRQTSIVKHSISKQADPLEKEGLIGVFCRTYTIGEAIDNFLSDIYSPSLLEGRYDYIPADSTAGVLVYEDKFAFSHHATDPACSKLCNAFDLVRIHKFGELDGKVDEDISPSKLPSFKAMQEFCMTDENVKRHLAKERMEQASNDFSNTDDEDWQTRLEVSKKGDVLNTLKNLITILECDPKLKSIAFNQLSDGMEIKGKVPWKHPCKFWRDADDAQLISYIDLTYGAFSARNYNIAVTKVTDDRSYHPIREFLDKLPKWDGVKRLETLFIDYFNANDEEYTRAVTRKVFIAAVARVMKPGIKFDWMLVLNGPPGIGKSTIIGRLASEWFNDSLKLSDTKDKTAAEKLQGYWILEIGELAGMSKVEENILKNFLSSQNDIYRASFGKRATPHPRQCIFIGTTNEDRGYLRDTTGNRRFWPLKVYGSDKKPWDMTEEEVRQIWAEAKVYFEANEDLQLSPELEKRANELQNEAMEFDERQGIIESYLEMLIPDDWDSFDIYKRREYINEYYNEESIIPKGNVQREAVSVIEIWCEAFGKNKADLERFKSFEITKMLKRIPCWVQDPKQKWNKLYGNTRIFKRVKF
jgi:predicted P-loop ATPase